MANTPLRAQNNEDESAHSFWIIRRIRDGYHLRTREAKSLVYPRFCHVVRAWLGVWVSSGWRALWLGRNCVGDHSRAAIAVCKGLSFAQLGIGEWELTASH
jgi:hypothetical protein